jgi:hypothetical protein
MIDLGWLGHIAFSWEFFVAVASIVLIDLVLAGDNAVVIAMAVKNLQGRERQVGIILGAGGAVCRYDFLCCSDLRAEQMDYFQPTPENRAHLFGGAAAGGRHGGS